MHGRKNIKFQVRVFVLLQCRILRLQKIHLILFLGGGAQQPPVGQGLLIHDVSRSHTTTYHSW